jgi:spore germination cell wall hydrolase CwlJ-like protein
MFKTIASVAMNMAVVGAVSFAVASPSMDDQAAIIEQAVQRANAQTVDITAENIDQFPQVFCLAQNIFFEAGIESTAGKAAVARVTVNRTSSERFPDSVCEVVKQGHKHANGQMKRYKCQFSWYCDGKSDTVPANSKNWKDSVDVAVAVYTSNKYQGLVEGAMWYHAKYVSPHWKSSMDRVGTIDRHIFYTQ